MKPTAVILANDVIHPADNGGRRRMAALEAALAPSFETVVVAPQQPLPDALRRQAAMVRAGRVVRAQPRLGTLVDADVRRRFRHAASGAAFALVTHDYLVPGLPATGLPLVVDFPNLEVDRQRSMATQRHGIRRLVAQVETLKAGRWEPSVARRAALCLCVSPEDTAVVRAWGGHAILAPNAAERCCRYEPSPTGGYALFLADFRYEPNRLAATRLVDEVWPLVLDRRPHSRLVLAGSGSADFPVPAVLAPSVDRQGYVATVHDCYRNAALVVNLVGTGAGTQLKMAEAMAHGRPVVTTPYGAGQVDEAHRAALVQAADSAPIADAVVRLLDDPARRDQLGRQLYDAAVTWDLALAPSVDAIEACFSAGRGTDGPGWRRRAASATRVR
jgi:hypothetical protein